MPESFGARLRQHRERRQIPLRTIAEQTKISLSLLEGLERDDVSRWPGGLFRRAFTRAYASAVGLDPEVVVREFLTVHPDPVEVVAIPCDGAAVVIPPEDAAPAGRLRSIVDSALGSLGRREAPLRILPPIEPTAQQPARVGSSWNPDVPAAARLCTELGRADNVDDLVALLGQMAAVLRASGLIVWLWDPRTERLWPALAHGYSEQVLSLIPPLRRDDGNATAAVFRTGEMAIVDGRGSSNGAIVAPLIGRGGPVGVLAIEVADRGEHHEQVRALTTIFAAQLAPLAGERQGVGNAEKRAAIG